MRLRFRTVICFSRILVTVERTLNHWFSWKKSSCTRESRQRRWNHKHHPLRCSETVWISVATYVNSNQTSMAHLHLAIIVNLCISFPQQTSCWLSNFIVITCLFRPLAHSRCSVICMLEITASNIRLRYFQKNC